MQQPTLKKQLSLFDSTCLIVGIIIGAGIYETSPTVAGAFEHWGGVMVIWIVGGLLSLCGALCYAELATAYPQAGGDYVYLNRAYGPWAGFLFGWLQLIIVRPGDIALMAFIFARFAQTILAPHLGLESESGEGGMTMMVLAGIAVVVLTAVNMIGVREGKWTQNILTVVKVLGLIAILVVALTGPAVTTETVDTSSGSEVGEESPLGGVPLSLAMILVLFTFGGWNEMAYVAAEVKNPNRNILRALLLGTISVTVLYLVVNGAFMFALGHEGVAGSSAVANETIEKSFPEYGGMLIAALICISSLGAINGLIFAGSRITYALGSDYQLFKHLGQWNPKTGTPIWALLIQAAISILLIVILGSFKDVIIYTAAGVYTFYLATSVAVVVLRNREPQVARPYKMFLYPLPILIFTPVCGFLIDTAVTYKPNLAIFILGVILLGIPIYHLSKSRNVSEIQENDSSED